MTGLVLSGDPARPAPLTVADLRAWPQHTARVSFERRTGGVQHHCFEGPLLHEVLCSAGPGSDPGRRKDRRRFLIAVTGADGHRALLSWAEIAPDFGQARVLLATRIDGTPLDARGPQPVLPQDRCGARHTSGITAVRGYGGYGGYGGRPVAEGDEGV